MSVIALKNDGLRNRRRIREMFLRNLRLLVWLLASMTLVVSTVALGLWKTPKNKALMLFLLAAMGLWIWLIAPRLVRVALTDRQANRLALLFAGGYSLACFLLARYSIVHFIRVKADLGVFIQRLSVTQHGFL